MRGATSPARDITKKESVSIHAPHARGDNNLPNWPWSLRLFQFTPLMRGATADGLKAMKLCRFQFTPLMRGATWSFRPLKTLETVSIHAPHARGDWDNYFIYNLENVSIHAPHARGDQPRKGHNQDRISFNSRPSCEGRHKNETALLRGRGFNSRPSCERRQAITLLSSGEKSFQFTPLMRGATAGYYYATCDSRVSIHAPHARGDSFCRYHITSLRCFNSRPSCEGRLTAMRSKFCKALFQFTPLMRGATILPPRSNRLGGVSIHAPHARGD